MTIPIQVLLAFAGWTVLTLLVGVGLVRWSQILTGRRQLNEFPADTPHGSPSYRRAVRAHANCVENLPVFGAVVVALWASGTSGPLVDALAMVFMVARVAQTTVHVAFEETNVAVGVRFSFFFVQVLCVLWLAALAT